MFTNVEKSRFDSCSELKSIVKPIAELRKKKEQLKSSTIGTIDYKKHVVLEALLMKFDRLIDNYNNKKGQTERLRYDELNEISTLLTDFMLVIVRISTNEQEVLATPRDNNRLNCNRLFHYSSLGAGAVLGTVTGGPLLGLGLFFAGGALSNVARDKTGSNVVVPQTILILLELRDKVLEVLKEINDILNIDRIDSKSESHLFKFELKWLKDEFNDLIKTNDQLHPFDFDDFKNLISYNTIYLHSHDFSIECGYKASNGEFKKYLLNDFLDKSDLFHMQQQKELDCDHQIAIFSAITRINSSCSEEINQNKSTSMNFI